jgi:hypothetical protein
MLEQSAWWQEKRWEGMVKLLLVVKGALTYSVG